VFSGGLRVDSAKIGRKATTVLELLQLGRFYSKIAPGARLQ
jgi:hypothetical protein